MATHSSVLAWKIPQKRNLAGYSPWGCKVSGTTKQLTQTGTMNLMLLGLSHFPSSLMLVKMRIGMRVEDCCPLEVSQTLLALTITCFLPFLVTHNTVSKSVGTQLDPNMTYVGEGVVNSNDTLHFPAQALTAPACAPDLSYHSLAITVVMNQDGEVTRQSQPGSLSYHSEGMSLENQIVRQKRTPNLLN